jgi:hypothetical protein
VRGDRRWIDTGLQRQRRGGTAFGAVTWRGAGRQATICMEVRACTEKIRALDRSCSRRRVVGGTRVLWTKATWLFAASAVLLTTNFLSVPILLPYWLCLPRSGCSLCATLVTRVKERPSPARSQISSYERVPVGIASRVPVDTAVVA